MNIGFTTARNNPIPVKNGTSYNNNKRQLFTDKSAVNLCFRNKPMTQSNLPKKIERAEVPKNNRDVTSMLKERGFVLDNCTLNNCVFNLSLCTCNKENNA